MCVARDGRPFDVDNHEREEPKPEEVEVIQFLLPDGRRRRMFAPVGEAFAGLAGDMVLTCERIPATGSVLLTARYPTDAAALAVRSTAVNRPGKDSPTRVLSRLILTLHARRQ